MNTIKPARRFSMIRELHLADWFTQGNAVCGTCAIFSIISYIATEDVLHVYYASGLIVAALILDILDGRIARWRRKSSVMGRELDSLADVISFGVAPAVIGYGCGLRGTYDRILLVYFVCCGVSRLARYNVTAQALAEESGKVLYFEGTPIPTSIVIVLMLCIATLCEGIGPNMWFGEMAIGGGVLHPLTLVFGLSGSLMISRIRIPKI